jgi:hypothetical protein
MREEYTMTGPEILSSVTDEDVEVYCRGCNDALTDAIKPSSRVRSSRS